MGSELDISMGFEYSDKKAVRHMGIYVVGEINIAGPLDKLIIEGKAANITASLTAIWAMLTKSVEILTRKALEKKPETVF